MTDKLILAMNSAFTDTSPDVRYYGKRIVIFLSPHQDFEQFCRRYLSSEDAQRILMFQARGNTAETLVKSGTMRRYVFFIWVIVSQPLQKPMRRLTLILTSVMKQSHTDKNLWQPSDGDILLMSTRHVEFDLHEVLLEQKDN